MNQPTGRWQTSSEGHKFSSRNRKITFRRRLSKEEKCGLEFGFWKSARNGGMKVSRPLKVRLFPNPGKCQPSRSVAKGCVRKRYGASRGTNGRALASRHRPTLTNTMGHQETQRDDEAGRARVSLRWPYG